MAASGSKNSAGIGFYTVTDCAEIGIVGGLLILNTTGRPLEFHCTAPLKPNRAQEILYGPTLRSFLYGEQIGAVLASKAKSPPLFLCTDHPAAMSLREALSQPLLLVTAPEPPRSEPPPDTPQRTLRFDSPAPTPGPHLPRLVDFSLGNQAVAVLETHAADQAVVEEQWQQFPGALDLREPFGRIREALAEAQRGAVK